MNTLHRLKVRYAVMMLLVCLPISAYPRGDTTMVSVSSSGVNGNSRSERCSISADGRYIVFESYASNLVIGDTNKVSDIFVHDRVSGKTERVSLSSSGEQGDSNSFNPVISANGRFIGFTSFSSNFDARVTGGLPKLFVYDRLSRKIELVSVNNNGFPGNEGADFSSISADGRFVAFETYSSNLVSSDTNNQSDVFVHDRLNGKTERVSVNSNGLQGDQGSFFPNISADGHFVAFMSVASNLVAGDNNFDWDIFVHDRVSGKTELVSIGSDGSQGNKISNRPFISADGRYISFGSFANNLVSGDTNDQWDIFVRDRVNKKTERVSVNTAGLQANDGSYDNISLSGDGRHVSFTSWASNLVSGDTNNRDDLFVHDRVLHTTSRASVNNNGKQLLADSQYYLLSRPNISADGRIVGFISFGNKVVQSPIDSNRETDVFVRDRTLDKTHQGDLKIELTTKPPSLAKVGQGAYIYTITNHGPDTIYEVNLTHVIANGKVLSFNASQGWCKRMPALSLCHLKRLDSGQSLTLTANVQALRDSVDQTVSVTSAARLDPVPANNYLTVSTPVRVP